MENKTEGKGGRGGEKCRVSGWGEEHLSPGQHQPPPLNVVVVIIIIATLVINIIVINITIIVSTSLPSTSCFLIIFTRSSIVIFAPCSAFKVGWTKLCLKKDAYNLWFTRISIGKDKLHSMIMA